jgi:hypothetical protein
MKQVLLWFTLLFTVQVYAQTNTDKCGYHLVKSSLIARNPAFQQQLDAYIHNRLQNLPTAKTTGGVTLSVTIPVVFHIILNTTQLTQINDSAGIADRVISQVAKLNQDYNRGNMDSTQIPAPFKSLYGNVNIKFALAHITPAGMPTSGWDITTTPLKGFDASANDPVGDAKHLAKGGTDAWDVTQYVNVWVINFLYGNQPSQILGLTVPPAFTADTISGFPVDEMGVLLSYTAFGSRTSPGEFFYTNIDLGRTLTHEIGHYFGLFHPWGDDNGLCPWNTNGKDDGIADTPPEGGPNYGCPTFPVYDPCSAKGSSNGIMFNNYMDYTNDACMNMFTLAQIAVMDAEIQPGGESHELTIHPALLQYPGNVQPVSDNSFIVTPNPTAGAVYISFNQVPTGFRHIIVKNAVGQIVYSANTTDMQTSYFPVDISAMGKGMYFITCYFANTIETRKIILL